METSSPIKKFITIHGHFYQPPRENPWTECIERQESSAPYHDWNERIASECYTPNAFSRILDNQDRIEEIVNNYAFFSYNFGATLLSWLERHAPQTYQRILEADSLSAEKFSGHGSAMAQAYNHIIMPLANERDKITQVRWGIADFKRRFGRDPEAMWLPETAVNYTTLEVLIDHGFKYLILSPFQAERIAPLTDRKQWQDVSDEGIDTTQPYRCFLKNGNRNKFIDIFFYHPTLSRGVAFEHLLRDAKIFGERINKSYNPNQNRVQLINIATDGESYGHHEPFGDMGFAYLMNVVAPKLKIIPTNYGEFLENNPPIWEVKLKEGPKGEGTSWSCTHGVGRWYRDCGCSSGGKRNWNQKWRRPLRKALDELRDDLAVFYEKKGARLLKDVWVARNDYIHVILDRSPESVQSYFRKHQLRPLSENEEVETLKLLELQRQAQLMYTSCGWFFSEISGIETVQIMKYAARAIQIAESLGGTNFETQFLSELKHAKSNIPQFQNGAKVYQKFVKPSVVTFAKVVNHFAIRSLFKSKNEIKKVYHYGVDIKDLHKKETSNFVLVLGHLGLVSGITREEQEYYYALLQDIDKEEFHCFVKQPDPEWNYEKAKKEAIKVLFSKVDDLTTKIMELWDGEEFSLADMLYDERQEIMSLLLEKRLSEIRKQYKNTFTKYQGLMLAVRKLGMALPLELKMSAEYTLNQQFEQEVWAIKNFTEVAAYRKALEIVRLSQRLGLTLDKESSSKIFQDLVVNSLKRLSKSLDYTLLRDTIRFVAIADRLDLRFDDSVIQNLIYSILSHKIPALIAELTQHPNTVTSYNFVTDFIQLAFRFNFSISKYKDMLKTIKDKMN